MSENGAPGPIRFERFLLDPASGELRSNGSTVRLAPQPLRVLLLLASRSGEVVTRDEIRRHIWGEDTFVDFDKGLNFCIKQIRAALGDEAERPLYIETLPRRGYRFKPAVEGLNGYAVNGHAANGSSAVATEAAPPTYAGSRSYLALATVAALALVLLAGLALRDVRPAIAFEGRDWILVGDFENHTAEPLFDGTLRYAMERELGESQFVRIVPAQRIGDVLTLMRRPLDTPLVADTARELALRDGDVRLLLTGRAEKVGPSYVLSASLLQPHSGAIVRSFTQEAAGQDDMLAAMRRLSRSVRSALGDPGLPSRAAESALEPASTSSLRALQLYSQAYAASMEHRWSAMVPLLRQALEEDADFASAHILLAHAYSNLDDEASAAPHYERAFALAPSLPDRERHFIVGSYYDRYQIDFEQARHAYEVLVRLYPDDYWGTNNLFAVLRAMSLHQEALPYLLRLADLRPDEIGLNYHAWHQLSRLGYGPEHRERFYARARKLAREDIALPPDNHWSNIGWAYMQLADATERIVAGDLAAALQEVDRVASRLERYEGARRYRLASALAAHYRDLGRLRAAEMLIRELPPQAQHSWRAQVAGERGDRDALRLELRRVPMHGRHGWAPLGASVLARAGLVAEAEAVLADEHLRGWPENQFEIARGDVGLAKGNPGQALLHLQQALASSPLDEKLRAAQSLALALQQFGDSAAAAETLERARAVYPFLHRLQLLRETGWQLHQLYRALGRHEDAARLLAELHRSLAVADEDHPILLAVARDSAVHAAQLKTAN